ncbi:MAG: GTP cyclohydrolase I FolE2 [Candidatus Eremiobacteraeota bacterium]|nr:GTP cyclohydrolase I FolE2 [Candidatus Eremiobacteraeota bacterium]
MSQAAETPLHTVYLGLGSNLGDRQGNIVQALQKLRASLAIEAVSAYYEAPPALGAQGPAYLNVAVRARTALEPVALEAFLRDAELAVGRQSTQPLAARPIDIDILLIDEICADFGRFAVPHPDLAVRPFNLVPLAEIAGDVVEPRSGQRLAALAARADGDGIAKIARSLHFVANRQDEAPEIALSIARVGVANVKRLVRLRVGDRERAFNGEFTMTADLRADKAGLHMSRFSELLEETTLDVLASDEGAGRIEDIVRAVARQIVASQHASRADVRLRAQFGLERWTPVSGKRTEETYTLIGIAHAGPAGLRHVVGVEAEGMTACPCAQLMMREHSTRELLAAGFTPDQAQRALDALPLATHNQRGRGCVLVGTPAGRDAEIVAADLVEIVENAMSSETYDLLKRPDEFFIVNKAHRNPRFVEDVVRGILSRTLDMYADFPDESFVVASQINYESIHKHDALAEGFGTFGELRRELCSRRNSGQAEGLERTDLAAWLGTRASPVTSPTENSTASLA